MSKDHVPGGPARLRRCEETMSSSRESWLTHTVGNWARAMTSINVVRSASAKRGSMPVSGSSTSSKAGDVTIARAKDTRWRMPPESWAGYRFMASASPTSSSQCSARARTSLREWLAPTTASWTFSRAVRHGKSRGSWNTIVGFPAGICTCPAEGWCRPAIVRSSVVFPQPDGPATPIISPADRAKVNPSTRVKPRRRSVKSRTHRLEDVGACREEASFTGNDLQDDSARIAVIRLASDDGHRVQVFLMIAECLPHRADTGAGSAIPADIIEETQCAAYSLIGDNAPRL